MALQGHMQKSHLPLHSNGSCLYGLPSNRVWATGNTPKICGTIPIRPGFFRCKTEHLGSSTGPQEDPPKHSRDVGCAHVRWCRRLLRFRGGQLVGAARQRQLGLPVRALGSALLPPGVDYETDVHAGTARTTSPGAPGVPGQRLQRVLHCSCRLVQRHGLRSSDRT